MRPKYPLEDNLASSMAFLGVGGSDCAAGGGGERGVDGKVKKVCE